MKDPCCLFYWGNWVTGTTLFSRRQKGAYMDLLSSQFFAGHLSPDDIKTILGDDYGMWETLLKEKFIRDEDGKYYNERLDHEVSKRQRLSEHQRDNVMKRWYKEEKNENTNVSTTGNTTVLPLSNIKSQVSNINIKDSNIKDLYERLELHFDVRFIPKNKKEIASWLDTLDQMIRIDKHTSEEIEEIVKWARTDDFWKTNFMSLLKLRKKNKEGIMYYDVFKYRMEASKFKDGKRSNTPKMSTKYMTQKNLNNGKA